MIYFYTRFNSGLRGQRNQQDQSEETISFPISQAYLVWLHSPFRSQCTHRSIRFIEIAEALLLCTTTPSQSIWSDIRFRFCSQIALGLCCKTKQRIALSVLMPNQRKHFVSPIRNYILRAGEFEWERAKTFDEWVLLSKW